MWNAGTSSSGNDGQLSEYERQRLENISQMSVEFSDLIENVSKSAENLQNSAPKTKVFANGKKRNVQQYRHIKMGSKRQETPQSPTVRRSKRINNEKRKRPEYDERSDSDDEKKPSKTLRLKFPFFMKSEYAKRDEDYYKQLDDADFIDSDNEFMEIDDSYPRSRRGHRASTNPHQVPVSLITEEMIKNITYSSCGKKYDAIKGTTCHQCRQKTLDQKSYCRYKNCRGIRGMFCGFCLGKRYGEDVAEVLLNKKWACPPCRGYCNCSICRRKQGISPTGQLSQIAEAGGYKSVKHMLENTEGGIPEVNLSSESDSDEDVEEGSQENIHGNTNNNINDSEVQNIDVKSEKEPVTEQIDNVGITEYAQENSSCEKQETADDKVSEENLSSGYDSEEDDPQSEQEEDIYEDIDNNLKDNKVPNSGVGSEKEPKSDYLNEKVIEMDQNHSLVESKNQCSINNEIMSSEKILDKIYQDLFCS